MTQIRYVALTCGLLAGLGCGGESDDGDGDTPGGDTATPIDTGLPDSTQVQALTPQQFTSACEALRADVDRRLPVEVTTQGFCEAYSAGLVNDPAECRSAAEICVTQVNNGSNMFVTREDLDLSMVECSSDTSMLQGCGATVGELEVCLQDRVEAIEGLLADNDCDAAASIDLDDVVALGAALERVPASCTTLQAECPGLEIATPTPQ
jgi:hypothetical protein